MAVVLLYGIEIVGNTLVESWFKHLFQVLSVLLVKSVNKGSVCIMKHRVLLVVVVENGAFQVPPAKEHVATASLSHIAALVH